MEMDLKTSWNLYSNWFPNAYVMQSTNKEPLKKKKREKKKVLLRGLKLSLSFTVVKKWSVIFVFRGDWSILFTQMLVILFSWYNLNN